MTSNAADTARRRRLQQRIIRTVALIALVVGAGLFLRRTFFPPKRDAATATTPDVSRPSPPVAATKHANGGEATAATSPGLQYDPIDPIGTLRLEGRVIDANEKPVPGIEVALSGFPRRTTITEDDGSFVFEGLIAQLYRLYARSEVGVAGPMSLQLTAASEPVTLVVHPGAELEFLVIDHRNKEPIAGAKIRLSTIEAGRAAEQAFALTAETDAAGKALLRGLPFGFGHFSVSASGYASNLVNFSRGPRLRDQVTVELVAADAVHGVVLQASGAPAPEVCVARFVDYPCETHSNSEGSFSISAATMGSIEPALAQQIFARHPDFGTGTTKPGEGDGTATNPFKISLTPNRVIRGTVRSERGEPVVGALVRTGIKMDDETSEAPASAPAEFAEFAASVASMFKGVYWPNPYVSVAATDAQGAFEISAPTTDQSTLGVVASFGAQVSNVVDVARDETTAVELRIIGASTAQLAGRVLQPDGTPADGAQVSASYARTTPVALKSMLSIMGPATTITNAEGEFVIGGLLPGEYVITAIDPAFTSERKPNAKVNAKTGTSNAVLTLPQAGSVRVVAHALDGRPITTTWVCVDTPVTETRTKYAPPKLANTCGINRDGAVLLAGIPVGKHTFEVSSRFSKSTTFTATIRHGETVDAGVITLAPSDPR